MALRAPADGARARGDRALHLGPRRLRQLASRSLGAPLPRTLLALTFVTGIVDAASFLALGQVFAAMMTGNFLFLGFGVGDAAGSSVGPPLIAIAAFLTGGAIGAIAGSRAARRGRGLAAAIAIEVAVLAAATVIAATATVRAEEGVALVLVGLLSLAMGARTTAVRRIGYPELPTNVLTIAVASFESATAVPGASPEHLVPRAAAAAAMLAGAIAGALLLQSSLGLALGVATVVSLAGGVALAATSAARAQPAG